MQTSLGWKVFLVFTISQEIDIFISNKRFN